MCVCVCVCVRASLGIRERGRLVRQNLPKTNSALLDASMQVGTGQEAWWQERKGASLEKCSPGCPPLVGERLLCRLGQNHLRK